MFKKILIANRGEIAARIVRTCRDLDIETVALYEQEDIGSLHVRLADVSYRLPAGGFMNPEAILQIASEIGVDAIHPGYGFLAERPDFARQCQEAGIVFIGPPVAIMRHVTSKLETLERMRGAGLPTVTSSPMAFDAEETDALREIANELDYPLVIKSCRGGRGRGERLVTSAEMLDKSLRRSQREAQAVFGNQRVYLEKAILPAHQVGVQILGDGEGNLVHLGEREGSLIYSNQKVLEESPAPCLTAVQRDTLCQTALKIGRLLNYQNVGTVEFLVDEEGNAYFTEIKARIQVDHPLTEIRTGIDLVREQIRIAAGEPLGYGQDDIHFSGWAMTCRINAEDPWRDFLPSPGFIERARLPGGVGVRVDTYIYCQSHVPSQYVALVAKLTALADTREACRLRLLRALQDFKIVGVPTNVPLLQQVAMAPAFVNGRYDTSFRPHIYARPEAADPPPHSRDLAAAIAVLYAKRTQMFTPTIPQKRLTGWHRSSRRLPE